jgi:N-acyl-D-amino-acid deacylase
MKQENMEKVICEPYTVIGTDSSAKTFDRAAGKPHPRAYGTFPRFFEHFVKSGKLGLAEAVRKCTGLSADILGLKSSGYLRKGLDADITVFDLDKIKDTATYENPVSRPKGIDYVLVNGRFAVFEGRETGERNGNVIFRE